MSSYFTNMDAIWLEDFAKLVRVSGTISIDGAPVDITAYASRLLAIADNLQGLDNKALESATLFDQGYKEGYAASEARMRRRSNILTNPEGEDATGQAIIAQIDAHSVTRVPLGQRTLEDRPHEFNAPIKKPHMAKPLERKQQVDISNLLTDI